MTVFPNRIHRLSAGKAAFNRYADLHILRLAWRRLIVLGVYLALLGAFFLIGAPRAKAGAGPHVIDDAGVETPGLCHVESWTTWSRNNRLINAAPACTLEALPRLEIGADVVGVRENGRWETSLGPALKLNLGAENARVDWAVAVAAHYDLRSGALEDAAVVLPVTVKISDRARLNANLAWDHNPSAEHRNAAFYGAQIEYDLRPDLLLMAETYQRHADPLAFQAGLRWTPRRGPVDVDLLVGLPDGGRETTLTFGLTFRGVGPRWN
ncbi:hypothetical protein [Brevundimonas sp.]|uniref:hypothetical protein n=1 Tax=Brevundimonas sp. TaxID=1871086 RepID=UPI001AC1A1F4|nr:hypothetical protein [Brevundimonas sp.]MBN9466980.1 hypothetical protein [Brevundimonas sp.]